MVGYKPKTEKDDETEVTFGRVFHLQRCLILDAANQIHGHQSDHVFDTFENLFSLRTQLIHQADHSGILFRHRRWIRPAPHLYQM